MDKGTWLHALLSTVARELVGIDYLKNTVEAIREEYGYECYCADVMNLQELGLQRTFDVIVCGELIEHIENPGLMLDGIKRFMHRGSILVITAPNPWSRQRMKLIRRGILENQWLNKEHVAWYSFQTLKQLLERKGFQEKAYDYYGGQFEPERSHCLWRSWLRLVRRKLPFLHTPTQCYDGLFMVAELREGE
jgi:SAM-dependent methyltransferase